MNHTTLRGREILVIATVSVVLAGYAYAIHPQGPILADEVHSFFGWRDSGQYRAIARILAGFRLPMGPENYTYGLGYPLLAVPFIWLGFERDPFIVPDVAMLALTLLGTYVFAVRVASRVVGALAVVLLLLASPLIQLTVEPWSSTVSIFGVTAALVLATSPKGLTPGRAAAFGALAAWMFAARFVDVIPVLAVAGWAVAIAPRNSRRWSAVIILGVLAAGVALVAITQWIALGSPLITPYASHVRENGVSDQSMGQYQLGWTASNLSETFITGLSSGVRVDANPLLATSPFLLLAPFGFVIVVRHRMGRPSLHVTVFVTSVVMTLFYATYAAGGGQDLIYRNARYWIPFYPYWTVLAIVAGLTVFRWMTAGARHHLVAPPDSVQPVFNPVNSSSSQVPGPSGRSGAGQSAAGVADQPGAVQ